jgi:hypothetical protein
LRFLLARWAPSCSLRIMRTAETKRKRANRSPPLENRLPLGEAVMLPSREPRDGRSDAAVRAFLVR